MHRHLLAPLTAAASLAVLSSPLSAQTLKVFLLAGQSNMEGQAYTFDDPAYANWNVPTLEFLLSGTPEATTYLANMPFGFKSSLAASWMAPRADAWCVQYDSSNGTTRNVQPTADPLSIFNGIGPLSPGFGVRTNNGSMFGAELAMGIRIADATTDPVFLFKSNKGGTTLAGDWRPPSAVAARGGTVGTHFTNTMDRFAAFLDTLDADLANDGLLNSYGNATSYEVCGFFWLQGFNDGLGSLLRAEYGDNLTDLIRDVRAADARIPADLPCIVIESSDQKEDMNIGRANAVATINAENPGSAVFFESENMINNNPGPVFWGNNPNGSPFSLIDGYHFHVRAENFLELGWIAGGAVLGNNWLDASDFWLDRPVATSVAFNQADISTAVNEPADTVTLYWGTSDAGPTATGWDQSASLGSKAAGAFAATLTGLSEATTYYYRLHGTSTALATDFWSAPNTLTTPLEFPVPEMGDPVVSTVQPRGASVQSTLLLTDANVTLVWANSDQGATNVSAWTSAPGGGSFSFGTALQNQVLIHAITGLTPETTYFFRFLASNVNADDWSESGTFTTPAEVSGLANAGWEFLFSSTSSPLTYDVSVFPGSAGWAGSNGSTPTSGTFGDGTVEAYAFFRAEAGVTPGLGNGDETIATFASGGTSITGSVAPGTIQSNNSNADIWITTDPAGFTSAADFTSNTLTGGVLVSNWMGSIDISGYASGTIYFMYGHYRGGGNAARNLDLTMRDHQSLAADIQLLDADTTDQPNNWEQYISTISFVNKDGYDSIDYVFDFAGNGRIGGIVLDGIPISGPSSPFDSWAGNFGGLTDPDADLDFDAGGLDTGIEWVVGGDPTNGSDDAGNAPTFDNSDPTYFHFTFKRRDAAAADPNTDIRVEYGSDLAGWRNTTDHGTTDGVLIDETTDLGGGFHQVTVSIPRSLAGDGRLFARLSAAITAAP